MGWNMKFPFFLGGWLLLSGKVCRGDALHASTWLNLIQKDWKKGFNPELLQPCLEDSPSKTMKKNRWQNINTKTHSYHIPFIIQCNTYKLYPLPLETFPFKWVSIKTSECFDIQLPKKNTPSQHEEQQPWEKKNDDFWELGSWIQLILLGKDWCMGKNWEHLEDKIPGTGDTWLMVPWLVVVVPLRIGLI